MPAKVKQIKREEASVVRDGYEAVTKPAKQIGGHMFPRTPGHS